MDDVKYKAFVVVEGKEFEILLGTPYNEEEAQNAAQEFVKIKDAWLGLSDGSMICVNRESTNFYFLIKPLD